MVEIPDIEWFVVAAKPSNSAHSWRLSKEFRVFLGVEDTLHPFQERDILSEVREEDERGNIFLCTKRNNNKFELVVKKRK